MATTMVTPNPTTTGQWQTVKGSQFRRTSTRVRVDGVSVGLEGFKPATDGTFTVGYQASATARTQVVTTEQKSAGQWTAIAPPVSVVVGQVVPPPPPPSQIIRQATPSTTMTTLQTWAADSTVDVVDFQSGTYAHFGTLYLKQPRTRPILWKTEPGVIFDGAGVAGTGAIHVATLDGPGTPSAAVGLMTFDFAGSVFQNYNLGSFGLLMTGWVNGIEFANVKTRNVTGSATLSHVFYVESDKVHHGSGVTIRNADVVGPTDKSFGSGVQVYAHNTATGTNNVHVIGGTFSNLNRFTYAYSDATGFLIDGVTISNVNVPIEALALPPLNQISGIVRNTHATGSGANRWTSPTLIDGGGNSFP